MKCEQLVGPIANWSAHAYRWNILVVVIGTKILPGRVDNRAETSVFDAWKNFLMPGRKRRGSLPNDRS